MDLPDTSNSESPLQPNVAKGGAPPDPATVRGPATHSADTAVNREVQAGGNVNARAIGASGGGWGWLIRLTVGGGIALVVVVLSLALLGIAQRTGWLAADASSGTASVATSAQGTKRYICPMMCTPPLAQPGRCPVCGMELVEATSDAKGDGISIHIQPAARRLAGIQTAEAVEGEATRTIRTIGSIDFDQSQMATIAAYIDGRIEKMFADYVGVKVAEGDDLATLYSPQLYSAQAEFVAALESRIGGSRLNLNNTDLAEMAREKLSELGMSAVQMEHLQRSRTPQSRIRIASPQAGTVIDKLVVEGDYVKTGQTIFRIADLRAVWLMLDLFPDDAAHVRFGQRVAAEVQSLPGEIFMGRVAFIDPTVDPKTRTVRVRVEILNIEGKLRPGEYATARIEVPVVYSEKIYDPLLSGKYISPMHPQIIRDEPGDCPICGMDLISTEELGFSPEPVPEQRVVKVPRDAVLLAGDQGVVYVETDPGRFEVRRVTVGPMTQDEAVILEGLEPGEIVATHGNFLIDSQMQLSGNPSLLDPSRAPRFAAGPIQLPERDPLLLDGEAATNFDRAYQAYFQIQASLAGDTLPASEAVTALVESLQRLENLSDVPDAARLAFSRARRNALKLDTSLEQARPAFRTVSHALLSAATHARGTATADSLVHYYCPMVPGGGGDWMQPGGELVNPYWGAEMYNCGTVVGDMAVSAGNSDRANPPATQEPTHAH